MPQKQDGKNNIASLTKNPPKNEKSHADSECDVAFDVSYISVLWCTAIVGEVSWLSGLKHTS
jgi:hypothetical protein